MCTYKCTAKTFGNISSHQDNVIQILLDNIFNRIFYQLQHFHFKDGYL